MIGAPPVAFLSYVDREEWLRKIAQRIAQDLRGKGFETYLASENPSPGTRFGDRIYPNIERSDAFVVLWTLEAPTSEWVVDEYSYARRIGRRVGLVREARAVLPSDWDPKQDEYIPFEGVGLRPLVPLLYPSILEPAYSQMIGLVATTVIQGATQKRGHNPMFMTPKG